ncbi:hypothetical protein JW758_04490 [Candidatus Peregrinibacteria bacterium]|nr:hypothetical protein [Candidatus Peregrinibacteria bacterium]
MIENYPDLQEALERLEITIKNPEGDKNFMIGFGVNAKEGKYSKEQLEAYSSAIEQVLEEAILKPIHRVGTGETNGPQLWEINTETTLDNLKRLITSIHISAEEYAEEASLLKVA